MKFEDLQEIIKAGPDTVVFFESVEDEDSITNTICALSNSSGGYLVFWDLLGNRSQTELCPSGLRYLAGFGNDPLYCPSVANG